MALLVSSSSFPMTTWNDVEQSPSRIVLLHMVDETWFFQEMANVTLENKRRYARRHGYEMVVHTPFETHGLLKPAVNIPTTHIHPLRQR